MIFPLQTRYAVITLRHMSPFPRIVIPDHLPIPVGSTMGTVVALAIIGTSAPTANNSVPPAWKLSVGATGSTADVGELNITFPRVN